MSFSALLAALSCWLAAGLEPPGVGAQQSTSSRASRVVALGEVLSTCIEAAALGCHEIRQVDAGSGKTSFQLKEDCNPRSAVTEADLRAQSVIISALKREWPDVDIIGEEDGASYAPGARVRRDLVQDETPVVLDKLKIFVDPLDGTHEFLQGRLCRVQCLVGIALSGRAIGGAIGLPFEDRVVHATLDKAVGLDDKSTNENPVFVAGDGPYATVASGRDFCERMGFHLADGVGGTGAKLLMVAEGKAAIAMTHVRTMAWDTCALEAAVRAQGGLVTDYFGSRLEYGGKDLRNSLGVIASAPGYAEEHDQLCRHLRGDVMALRLLPVLRAANGLSQAVDVARDLDGNPLSLRHLSQALGYHVDTYAAPEEEAVRGLMSSACRLRFDDGTSAFYKRVVFAELDYQRAKSSEKIVRDVQSYAVEAAFLSSSLALKGLDVAMPTAYAADLRPSACAPLDSKFAILMRDFDPRQGWYQRNLITDLCEARAAIAALAVFHAHFWGISRDETRLKIWERGSYWEPRKQDTGQLEAIAASWPRHHQAFSLPDELRDLGSRLQSVALDIASDAHDRPPQTVIHGDPKAANIFFRAPDEAGLIDFQWTGFGRAANDVGHFLCAAVDASLLEQHECHLLDHYSATLRDRLQDNEYDRTQLQTDYETAVLDTCRLVFAYQWNRIHASPSVLERFAHSPGRNSYNKNLPNALWLIRRCDEILSARKI